MSDLAVGNYYAGYNPSNYGNYKKPVPFTGVQETSVWNEPPKKEGGNGLLWAGLAAVGALAVYALTRGKNSQELTKAATSAQKAAGKAAETHVPITAPIAKPNGVVKSKPGNHEPVQKSVGKASEADVPVSPPSANKPDGAVNSSAKAPESLKPSVVTNTEKPVSKYAKIIEAQCKQGKLTKSDIDSMDCDILTKKILYNQHGIKESSGYKDYIKKSREGVTDPGQLASIKEELLEDKNIAQVAESMKKIMGRPLSYGELRVLTSTKINSHGGLSLTERMDALLKLPKEKVKTLFSSPTYGSLIEDYFNCGEGIKTAEDCQKVFNQVFGR